jgi:hypothetical protein
VEVPISPGLWSHIRSGKEGGNHGIKMNDHKRFKSETHILYCILSLVGPGSIVGIATGYEPDGSGSNPGGGEIFRTCPDWPWGPPSLLHNGYRVFPGGKEWPGNDADPSHPSSAIGHEIVELYLYSPYGSYGLYRASV